MIELTLNKRRLVVIDDNKNKILDDENSEYRENNCDNQSVGESITRLRFDLAEEEWFESTEEQKINLKKNNSSKHLPIDFSSQTPEMQKNIWDNCVSNFDFKEFRNKLTLAEISIKELASKLEEFKLKIIHSILRQNRYFIDKKKLESIPDDGSFFLYVIYMCDCISFPSRENFCDKQGNKITTLITELSKWMKGKKLTIFFINYLLFCYYKDIYQCLASENLELDEPLLSLDNLKKIILCIDFNQNKNTDRCYNEIYCFFCSVCDLLIGMKQDNQYIKVYIANLLSYFGYKTEGIENVENQPESLSNLPTAKEFYENTTKSEGGLGLLMCIKALGFTLVLAENEIFKLEQVDEVDKLIASIGYQNDKELNNWVKGVNTINEEDRNEIAEDENANDNYLEITSFDDFKNMKKNSIVSFIEKSKNANKLKKKYQVLLEKDKQDKLDEVILNKDVVDWMLHNLKTDVFEAKDVQDVADIVKKFYKYTNKPNEQISSTNLILLLTSFQEESLTNDNVNPILEINGKNDGYELEAGNGKMRISYLFYILRSLNERQGIPEKLITLIMQTIDFESTDLNNDNDRYYFYGALFFLIRCSGKYDENNPKEAIKDVFKGTNKILNELLKIQDAKDYLNVGVMQREEMYGSKLALLFAKSSLKISFKSQENKIVRKGIKNEQIHVGLNNENENVNNESNLIECKLKLGNNINELNSISQEDLDFKLTNMDEVEKLIIELSQENDLNNWVKGVNATDEERRNQNAEDGNAKDNYLEIKSFDAFKNMKKNSILSFIENSQNEGKLTDKYKILLEKNNQDKLDEIILNKDVVDWMLHNLKTDVFEEKDVRDVIDIIKKFYKYTDEPNAQISSLDLMFLLSSFKEESLTNNNVNLILEINGKNDGSKLEDGTGKKHIGYLLYVLRALSLDDKQGIPENLITLIMQTINFKSADLKDDVIREYFYGALFFLIRCWKQYDETNPKKAIEDVFNGKNKILNELLKIQNAKDYLNVGVMQKEKNFGSKLADLFVKSELKISFEAQEKNQLYEMKENKINENDNNIIENANKSGKENNDENNLKFKLKDMDEVEKLIIELSQENDLNNWVKGVNTTDEKNRNQYAQDENANNNYLKITSLDAFKNMKKNSILSFIKNSENKNELQDKYKILLKEDNQDKLDEIILNKNVVDWMLQNLNIDVFEGKDVQNVADIVRKFYQYTDKPSDKASPWTTIDLLMAFKQGSLNTKQMLKLLEINNWNDPLNPNDLDHDLYKVWSILSALKTGECIPKELFFLIDQTVDFNSIDLNNDGETESLFNIITCLIEHSKKYDPENVSKVINDIFGYQVDDISEESQACRKFVRESLLKIPSCQERINELLEISQKPDYEKKLVKMFSSDGISKITIKEELGEEEEMGEYEEEVVSYESESENNNSEIERSNSWKLKSSKNLLAKIDIEDQNPNFDTKSVKNLDMDINKLFFNIGIDNEDNDKNTKLANELESLKNKNLELLNRLQQVDAENNQLKNVIYEKERLAEELKTLNDKSENENDYGKIKRYNEEYNIIQNESICFQREKNKIDKNLKSENTNLVSELEDLKKRKTELLNELEQLEAKISEYKNNQVQEISNVNPKTQSKPNKKLKYTLYIFALIIAVASVAIGFYMSLYAFLGLIVSLILLFVVSYLNSKSQEENNFKLINNNGPNMTNNNQLNKYKDINNITQLDLNPNKLKESQEKEGN